MYFLNRGMLERLSTLIDNHIAAQVAAQVAAATGTKQQGPLKQDAQLAESALLRYMKFLRSKENKPGVLEAVDTVPKKIAPQHKGPAMTKLADNLKKLPPIAYFYNDIGCDGPPGSPNPPAIMVKRGEPGYYPVYDTKSPNAINNELGISYEQSRAMLNGAMHGWHLAAADADHPSNAKPKFFDLAIINLADNSERHFYFNDSEHVFAAMDQLRKKGTKYEARSLQTLTKAQRVCTFKDFQAMVDPVPNQAVVDPATNPISLTPAGGTK